MRAKRTRTTRPELRRPPRPSEAVTDTDEIRKQQRAEGCGGPRLAVSGYEGVRRGVYWTGGRGLGLEADGDPDRQVTIDRLRDVQPAGGRSLLQDHGLLEGFDPSGDTYAVIKTNTKNNVSIMQLVPPYYHQSVNTT